MLRVHNVNAGYGAVKALWDVTISVDEGEVVVVLGADGAGKTTLVKAIVGLIEPSSGMIKFAGQRIEGRDAHRISELGISYGPEGGGVFRDMSVQGEPGAGGLSPSRLGAPRQDAGAGL